MDIINNKQIIEAFVKVKTLIKQGECICHVISRLYGNSFSGKLIKIVHKMYNENKKLFNEKELNYTPNKYRKANIDCPMSFVIFKDDINGYKGRLKLLNLIIKEYNI